MEIVRDYARANTCSLWRAAGASIAAALGPKAGVATHAFMTLIERLAQQIHNLELHEQVDHVIQASGLLEHHKKEKGRSRRSPRRQPPRAGERGARLHPGNRQRHDAAECFPVTRGAGSG